MTRKKRIETIKALSDLSRNGWTNATPADYEPLEHCLASPAEKKTKKIPAGDNRPYQIYRLTLDENGQEAITDYSLMADAETAFHKACRRKAVFSANVQAYSTKTYKPVGGRIFTFERN